MWKTTNLHVGFDPYFAVTIRILAFFSLCILISLNTTRSWRVGVICRKIILFSSSLRADTWFWSIHSSHDHSMIAQRVKRPFIYQNTTNSQKMRYCLLIYQHQTLSLPFKIHQKIRQGKKHKTNPKTLIPSTLLSPLLPTTPIILMKWSFYVIQMESF